MHGDTFRPMTEQERMKYEAANELGLMNRLLSVGWGGLTAVETGRIGALVAQKMRRLP